MNSGIIELLTPAIENKEFHISLIFLFIVAIYIISNGTNSIIIAANNIYGIKQKTYIQRRIKALFMVIILISLFIFIAIVPVFGNFLLSLIERATGFKQIYGIINVIKTPISWLVIFIFIKILYTIAPDKHIPSSNATIGAVFTSAGWIVATDIYLYYVGHFAHYSRYYSGLANIAVLMVWMYILATIFVIGLAINYQEEPDIERTREMKSFQKKP